VRHGGADALTEAERRADEARYQEVTCRSALNRVEGMPFNWTLNPYRGCTHGCHYCFARRYHAQFEMNADDEFSSVILVKRNFVDVLRRELDRPSWGREQVAFGTATDPYQPIEGHYRITRDSIVVLALGRTPIGLITKGPMVVRDRDVLLDLTRAAGCTVYMSVPTVDEEAWRHGRRSELGQGGANDVARELGGDFIDEARKVDMRAIVGAIRHRAQHREWAAEIGTHLGHGRPFHLDREGLGQRSAQGQAFAGSGDEAVAADDEPAVQARPLDAEARQRGVRGAQHAHATGREGVAQARIGRKVRATGERHFVAREQRRGIHVMLQQRSRDHDVTDVHACAQAAGHTGEQQGPRRERIEHDGGRRRGGHLADAAERQQDLVAIDTPEVAVAAATALGARVLQQRQQRTQFLVHGADDRDSAHGVLGPQQTTAR